MRYKKDIPIDPNMKFDRLQFWRYPSQAGDEIKRIHLGKMFRFCQAKFYLKMDVGKQMTMSTLPRYASKEMSFFEYGCNTGKCLVELYRNGYRNVQGLEISPEALDLGRKSFKELKHIPIINAPLEDEIRNLPQYDVIYGVGVLMHLPYELDWVIEELGRKAKYMIMTAENEEETDGVFKFARNYKDIYERLGWVQVEQEYGDQYPPYPHSTVKRVFLRDAIERNPDE